jgi:proline iminopeptidase
LLPHAAELAEFTADAVALGIGRLEAHYMLNGGFFEDDQLIRNLTRIRHLPAVIVQGRYDVICPPGTADRLHRAWPESRFHLIPDAGHAAMEVGIAKALVAATDQFRDHDAFE